MIVRIFLIFIIISFSTNAFSTKIRVLDFQHIIENNINIAILYDKIDKDQIFHKENFKKEELNLKNELDRIEKLKLIPKFSQPGINPKCFLISISPP